MHVPSKLGAFVDNIMHFGVVAIVNCGMINVACPNSTGTSNNTMVILSPRLSSREATKSLEHTIATCIMLT